MDYRVFLYTHPFSPKHYKYATLGWLQNIYLTIYCRDQIAEIITQKFQTCWDAYLFKKKHQWREEYQAHHFLAPDLAIIINKTWAKWNHSEEQLSLLAIISLIGSHLLSQSFLTSLFEHGYFD